MGSSLQALFENLLNQKLNINISLIRVKKVHKQHMAKHPPVLVLNAFVLNVGLLVTVVYPSNTESILHFRDPCGCTGTDVVEVLFGLFDFMPHVTAQDADESLLSYTVSKDQKVTSGYLLS